MIASVAARFCPLVLPRLIGLSAAVGLYTLSFFLPVTSGFINLNGAGAFLLVAAVMLGPDPSRPMEAKDLFLILGFLPNPLLWAGVVVLALGWWRWAAAVGAAALGLGLIWMFNLDRPALEWKGMHAGYGCWMASMAALAAASMLLQRLPAADGCSPWRASGRVTLLTAAGTIVVGMAVTYYFAYWLADRLP